MPYDERMCAPMRAELTSIGVEEMRTPEDVDRVLGTKQGTVLVFVNSVCGCAAGNARPAMAMAIKNDALPDRVTTVFAGQDTEATARARSYFKGYPPSSPQIALLRDGEVVHMIQRHHIEGQDPRAVAMNMVGAFDKYCVKEKAAVEN